MNGLFKSTHLNVRAVLDGAELFAVSEDAPADRRVVSLGCAAVLGGKLKKVIDGAH